MKFHLSDREKAVWEHAKHVFSFVFQTLLVIFLLVLLVREFYPAKINSYININWFMIVVIVFGALSIIFPPAKTGEMNEEKDPTWKDKALIIVLALLGGVIIYLKLKNLGWIGIVIPILGALIIGLLSWLVLTEKDEDQDNENTLG